MNLRLNFLSAIFSFIILIFANNIAAGQSFPDSDNLLDNWGGGRKYLSDKGIDLSAVYTGDVFSDLSGGIKKGTVYLDNIDLTAAFDMDKLIHWEGGEIFIYGLGNHGKDPSEYFGDVQTADNIAAFSTWKIYEAWIQQNLFNEHLSVLAGLYDLNSEFQTLISSGLFLNSSHGIGIAFSQSGRNGPSIFPTTALALRIKFKFTDNIFIQSALFNGTAGDPSDPYGTKITFPYHDGILSVTELQYYFNSMENNDEETDRESTNRLGRFSEDDYVGKISAGYWMYSAKFPKLGTDYSDNKLLAGNSGFYIYGEYKITGSGGINDKGLSVFGKLGFADPMINRFVSYTGFGAVYNGLIPGRDNDQIGIAAAGAHNGNRYLSFMNTAGQNVVSSEWNLELTYLSNIFPWLTVQPDFQYIIKPDTDPNIENAFAFGIRVGVSL